MNPHTKLWKLIIGKMPPHPQHPSSPSKFRPLSPSSKRPIVVPHRVQRSIPVNMEENHPTSLFIQSKSQTSSGAPSSKQISEDQQPDGKPTALSTTPSDPSNKPTYPIPLSLPRCGVDHEPKSKEHCHVSFLLPKVPLPRNDINELFESTCTVRPKGCFELTLFYWMGGKCPRCSGDIAYHSRDWRKVNSHVKLIHTVTGIPRFVQGVSLCCQECNQYFLSIDNKYT